MRLAVLFVMALLAASMLVPPAHAQEAAPSSAPAASSGASTGSALEIPSKTAKPAAARVAQHKKKRSFVQKMRDKAKDRFQKLLGSKESQELFGPKQE
jgi:uncharacterized membrane protein